VPRAGSPACPSSHSRTRRSRSPISRCAVGKTIDLLKTFKPEQIDGSEEKELVIKVGGKDTPFRGMQFLLGRSIPNFYFHVATAYDILRHNGVEIGKRDFLGPA
jgi:hypothetical protein